MASVFFDPAVGGNGSTVSDDANPATGLRRGGYLTRFVPALVQFVAMAFFAKGRAEAAATSAANASGSASSAQAQRDAADLAKVAAQQAKTSAETARDAAQAFAGLAQATNPLEALQVNKRTVSSNQTLAPGFNAVSAGPIEIPSGVTVVISENSTWSIV
jgi:hypothetical protein